MNLPTESSMDAGNAVAAAMGRFIPVGWLLKGLSADGLGEVLRELTFPEEGFGCYSTFDVRKGARKWDRLERYTFWQRHWNGLDMDDFDYAQEATDQGEGYTWTQDGLRVDVCWYWDGDGTLAFTASGDGVERRVVNTDCKKSYRWDDLP